MSLPSLFNLSGQRVLVTGAASGIGLAIAEAMLEAGAEVIMSDLDAELLRAELNQLQSRYPKASGAPLDVSDTAAVDCLVDSLAAQPGGIDCVSTLNAPLFIRTNRGLVPTEAGICAVRFARLIQSDIGHLQHELSVIASGAGGRIAVGIIMGAVPLLTRALTQMMDRQPEFSVEIVEDTSDSLLGLIDQDGSMPRSAGRRSVPSRISTTRSSSRTST